MDEAKAKRTMAKAQFTRIENALRKLVENEVSLQETTERKFGQFREKWQELQNCHDSYALLLTGEEAEKEEDWIAELCERFEALEADADKNMQRFKKDIPQVVSAHIEEISTHSTNAAEKKGGVKLERLKLEKFDGNLRKYPAFKDSFKRYIEPMCPKSQLAFMIRSHLEEPVKEEVANVEDDHTLLWDRLDAKYGNLRKYTDAVLADLTKISKGDSRAALHLINTVEKAYQDLNRIGLQQEMSNSYIISMIEKKLPEEMRMEWIKTVAEKGEIDSEIVFKLLMEFLRKWRNIIEYDDSAIRKAPEKKVGSAHHAAPGKTREKSEVCWLHEDGKHPIWKCNIFRVMPIAEKMSLIEQKKACQACLETACIGSSDPEGCQKKFRCTLNDCDKPHNLLIHQ